MSDELELELVRLRARVTALERALRDRSRMLRELTRTLCPDDLAAASLVLTGEDGAALLDAHRYYSLTWFSESTSYTTRDVEPVMHHLWESAPRRPTEDED